MAHPASTNITVTIASRDREIAGAAAGRNMTLATVAFGDGSLQYDTGGVPLPAIGAFGFRNEITMALIQQPPANGFIYKFDPVARTIKIFTQSGDAGAQIELPHDTVILAVSLQILFIGD